MRIVRRVFVPTLVVVVAVIVGSGIAGGREAFGGAAVGGGLTLAFLGASPGLLDPVAKASPVASLPVALGFFTVKAVAAVAVLMLLLGDDGRGPQLSSRAVAAAMIITALTWVTLHFRALRRVRTPIYDLG
ncbi:MAG: hypothetical protein QM597_07975 [Aeromicrobium sp.]|uniref:hypothetical protein n=1 Tax=Aeromicrobium sp. TaxID=1871063 RepID=UPI0039E6340F